MSHARQKAHVFIRTAPNGAETSCPSRFSMIRNPLPGNTAVPGRDMFRRSRYQLPGPSMTVPGSFPNARHNSRNEDSAKAYLPLLTPCSHQNLIESHAFIPRPLRVHHEHNAADFFMSRIF